jgi:hypothetical protein
VPRYFHLERYPGKYVAIDMASDEVVLTADTPEELHEQIQAKGLRTSRLCVLRERTNPSSSG